MEVPPFRFRVPGTGPDPIDPLALLAAWWRAVGGPMARVASPRGVERRRLQVAVPDVRWKREMTGHLEEILARLRQVEGLGRLEGIDLVLEAGVSGDRPSAARGGKEGSHEDLPREIELSTRSIPDTEIARRWTAAVARILARREIGRDS